MTQKRIHFLVITAVLLLTTPSSAEVRYNLINLGILDGYPQPRPVSINNKGQIVGFSWPFNAFLVAHATLFDSSGSGGNIDLGTLGGDESVASSINNRGQIIGYAETGDDPPVWWLTVFDASGSGSNKQLFRNADAWSINDHGIISGAITIIAEDNSFVNRAATFSIDLPNSHTDLGLLEGFDNSNTYSINNNGQVVGIAYQSGSNYLDYSHAAKFDGSDPNNNIDLGTLPGYESATATCINDSGQIVGRVGRYDFSRATLFDSTGAGNNIDLGTIPGFDGARAFSINSRSQIVGCASMFGSADCAVIFDATGQQNNINLNDMVETGDDLYLSVATAINDNGWITGFGGHPGDSPDPEAFLLIPIAASVADFEPDGDVDLDDYAILTSAWKSRDGDANWNPVCDISMPPDGTINGGDLRVFTANWLTGAE